MVVREWEGNQKTGQFTNEPMLEMYIFETPQMIEQLEKTIIETEKESDFTGDASMKYSGLCIP